MPSQSPILILARDAWALAGSRRWLVVLYLSMFAAAVSVKALM